MTDFGKWVAHYNKYHLIAPKNYPGCGALFLIEEYSNSRIMLIINPLLYKFRNDKSFY